MGKLVTPEVYYLGATAIDLDGMRAYLDVTDNLDFLETMQEARRQGLSDAEIICSFYAKLCYASLTLGKNENVSRIRDIPDNLRGAFDQGHGSVFEHAQLNFAVHNCSRVFETELVRHRAGTAFSILSGRYHRSAEFDLVFDPILEPVRDIILSAQTMAEAYYADAVACMKLDDMKDFAHKKKITSALRRILPEGKAKEVGFSMNIRAVRHTVQLRTSRAAEWEIRNVFGQVYRLLKDRHPLLFYGAREETVDGLLEVSNMKMQPYEK